MREPSCTSPLEIAVRLGRGVHHRSPELDSPGGMVRLVPRLLRRSGPSARAVRRTLPPPGVLRRERRALLEARETELRDLGGLLLEMYKQNRFRQDLLEEHCESLAELDRRLFEIESLLSALRRGLPPGRCECGAPLVWGSHFCANCGRPIGDEAVVTCGMCGYPLAADTSFCANCGNSASGLPIEALDDVVDVESSELASSDGDGAQPAHEPEAEHSAQAEPAPDSVDR
jgi:hypothetical protein